MTSLIVTYVMSSNVNYLTLEGGRFRMVFARIFSSSSDLASLSDAILISHTIGDLLMHQEPNLNDLDEPRDVFSLNMPSLPMGVTGSPYPTSGFLHQDGDAWVVTTEDFLASQVLPSFIKDRDSALSFLRNAYDQFYLGITVGASAKDREVSNTIAKTFGLCPLETVVRLQRDLEKLQERLDT